MSDLNRTSWNDNWVERNIKKTQDPRNLFLNEFSKFIIDSWKTTVLDEIYKFDFINESSDLKKNISIFMSNSDLEEIKDFDISKITIEDLKRKFSSYFFQINNSRNLLRAKIRNEFLVSDSDMPHINQSIISLSKSDIDSFLSTKIKLKKFVNWIWNYVNKKVNSSLFNLSSQEINSRLSRVPEIDLEEVKYILVNISEWKIVDSEIRDLLSTDFFTVSEKRQFVLDFIPTASLDQLEKIWYYSKSEAETIKSDIILSTLNREDKLFFDSLSVELQNKIISSTNLSDVIIDVKTLTLDDENVSKIWEKVGFKNLENEVRNQSIELNSQERDTWPQTFELLKTKLEKNSKNWKIKDIEKFSKDNFVEIIIKDEKWNSKNTFLKLKDFDDDKKVLKFFEVWANDIINFSATSEKEMDFKDFLFISWKEKISMVFHKEQDLKDKVKSWKISTMELFSYTQDDLNNPDNKRWYTDKFISSKQKELDKLRKLQEEWKLTDLDRARMNSLESIVNSRNVSDEELLDFLNFETLLSKLDDLDSDWKDLKLWKWVLLQVKDGWIHEILWVSDWKISVNTQWQIVEFTYDEFYETFKKFESKRIKKINDFWELLSDFEKKWWDKWQWFSFENNKFSIKEENKKNPDKKVEYLVSDKEDDIVKIHEISWNKVVVSFWERKEKWKLDKKDKNFKDKSEEEILFIKWAKKVTLSLNEFKSQVLDDEKYNFRPSWETWKKLENTEAWSENKFKWWFFTKLFNRASFADILSWWKMLLSSIEDTLKRWNELKAARFALSAGWFLPEELRAELQIKVEREEAESMDKALDWLSKVDSWIAVKRIKWWLENKDTPEYKKEAWLMFMLSKYWHLTAKWDLYNFRWKYLWYEAFWWKVWDEFFLEKKKECLDWWITFSEEYLMHMLLKKQCSWQWYNWIKRRSRLHKEFEWKWGGGIKDELEKGHSDASKKRKASDMVKWGMDEASWWTTSNAIWWFKKAIERWWSIEDMSEWFFCLLYSGACYDLDQKTYLNIRDLWGSGMPILMTKFFSTVPEMNLFNDTILELSKEIWKAYGDKFPSIAKDAQELYDNAKNKKWSEKERLNKTQDFWKKYGTPLSRSLNMLNTSDWTYSKTDKILFLKKDENPEFWKMYDKIREISAEWGTFKADYMWDACWAEWLSWLDVHRVVIKYLAKDNAWGFRDKDTWPIMWQKISEDLKSTNSKVFSDDKKEDLRLKKKYLLQTLREVVWWIVELSWSHPAFLDSYNNLTTETWIDFKNWWLTISDFKEFSPSMILKWKSDEKLSLAVDNILSWRDVTSKSSNKIESVFDDIKSSIDTQLPRN